MRFVYWNAALVMIDLVAVYVVGRKSWWGWFLGLAGDALWIPYALVTAQFPIGVSAVVYGSMKCRNLLSWRRDSRAPAAAVGDGQGSGPFAARSAPPTPGSAGRGESVSEAGGGTAVDRLDADLAAWSDPSCVRPRLCLLGPVQVRARGDRGRVRRRLGFYTEVVAFVATRDGGVTAEQIAAVFGLNKARARTDMSNVRHWLGVDPETRRPYMSDAYRGRGRAAGTYRIEGLLVDADLFYRLRQRGQARGRDGLTDLQAALGLVRGAPFDRLRPGGYRWLAEDPVDQRLVRSIVEVADLVVGWCSAAGDRAGVAAAAEIAAVVAPELAAGRREADRADRAAGPSGPAVQRRDGQAG